uniref:Uncharacterized protein n=1 Tax=Arundo donax TaxID=35708 RepID=A0A0A8Z6B0_ARUDO
MRYRTCLEVVDVR